MRDEEIKIEAVRMAIMIMTQSCTAAKGNEFPTPGDVLREAKKIYEWIAPKN